MQQDTALSSDMTTHSVQALIPTEHQRPQFIWK